MTQEWKYFRIERQRDVVVVTLTVSDFRGEVTNFESKRELIQIVQGEKPDKLVIDFQNVQSFSSDFIGTLLSLKRQVGTGGKIKLCSMQPAQREIFRVCRLDDTVFPILANVDAAVQSFF